MHYLLKDWRMDVLGKFDTVQCNLLNRIEANTLDSKYWKLTNSWIPYDSTAIAALIEPNVSIICCMMLACCAWYSIVIVFTISKVLCMITGYQDFRQSPLYCGTTWT